MKNSGFFQTLIGSFYNPQTYKVNEVNKKGNAFGYLLLLVIICNIPLIIAIVTGFENFMKNDGKYIIDQLPEITFSKGTASIDKESPYFIKSQAGETLIVIDLSDSASITELQGSAKVLLTKNKLIAQQKENETRTYDLSKVQNFTLNAQKIYGWFGYAWVVYVLIFVIMIVFFYIYRLVQALFNALIGLIISSIMKINLDYSSLLYICMVAITPVAVLASIIWATEIDVPAKGWLGFILALGYISFGILANKPEPQNTNLNIESTQPENDYQADKNSNSDSTN